MFYNATGYLCCDGLYIFSCSWILVRSALSQDHIITCIISIIILIIFWGTNINYRFFFKGKWKFIVVFISLILLLIFWCGTCNATGKYELTDIRLFGYPTDRQLDTIRKRKQNLFILFHYLNSPIHYTFHLLLREHWVLA